MSSEFTEEKRPRGRVVPKWRASVRAESVLTQAPENVEELTRHRLAQDVLAELAQARRLVTEHFDSRRFQRIVAEVSLHPTLIVGDKSAFDVVLNNVD
jgi:hypothetical protein